MADVGRIAREASGFSGGLAFVEVENVTVEESTRKWLDMLRDAVPTELGHPRSRAYHFSAEGSDETGDGSREHPWRTQAKAQEILDARSDVAILFRRGYEITAPLTIRHENVTVGSYGEHRDA